MTIMNNAEYLRGVTRTLNERLTPQEHLLIGALGLCGESGEVADLVKKALAHQTTIDSERLQEELSDVLWYMALICTLQGWTLEDLMQTNVAKLQQRYPEGWPIS